MVTLIVKECNKIKKNNTFLTFMIYSRSLSQVSQCPFPSGEHTVPIPATAPPYAAFSASSKRARAALTRAVFFRAQSPSALTGTSSSQPSCVSS